LSLRRCSMAKKKRRKYTKEFKEEAVRLISEEGYSYAEAGRNLGVNPNLLSRWKREFEGIELDPGSAAGMQAELKRLRKENKRLKMEREILKKAAAFFAKEQK
jgi:transposase